MAVKECLPGRTDTRMGKGRQTGAGPGGAEEARRLARFESVPGIVQVYDCFETGGITYIVMEYLEGMSLKEYLAARGKMTAEQALPVILQVASAMEAVHKAGILHRDIAPDNIYVLNPEEPENLKVKLLDFGAARCGADRYGRGFSVILKPGYAPGEQYSSHGDQGTWTDVYALAAVFYKMLTGITPDNAMDRSVKDELKRPSRLRVKITKPMETALMNALQVNGQDRTRTMACFSRELTAKKVPERRKAKGKRDPGAMPRWFLGAAGAGLAAAATTALLLVSGAAAVSPALCHGKRVPEPGMVRVPHVANRPAREAEALLSAKGLSISESRRMYSDEIPAGMVFYQELRENTMVKKGTLVVVWISLGAEPEPVGCINGK